MFESYREAVQAVGTCARFGDPLYHISIRPLILDLVHGAKEEGRVIASFISSAV